jgi:hypothetical protein
MKRTTLIRIIKNYWNLPESNNLTEKRKLEILINLNKLYIKDTVLSSKWHLGLCECLVLFKDLGLINSREYIYMKNYIFSEIHNLDEFYSDRFKVKNKQLTHVYNFESNENRYFFIDYLIKKLANGNN